MADRRASLLRPAFTGGLVSGVLVVSALGCGGDEEAKRPREPPARGETTGSGPTAPVPTATAPSATAPPSSEARPRPGKSRREDPESVTGGVGDEEAARAPAMFTGRGGRITPRVVRVPPFLGIAVEVRSADGRDYAVGFGRVIALSLIHI